MLLAVCPMGTGPAVVRPGRARALLTLCIPDGPHLILLVAAAVLSFLGTGPVESSNLKAIVLLTNWLPYKDHAVLLVRGAEKRFSIG